MEQRQLSFIAYDTICKVTITVPEGADGEMLLGAAGDLAAQVETTLSMFDGQSELSRMCMSYVPGQPYPVSLMLFTFMEQTLVAAAMTDGAFDPTVGPLVKLWDFLADSPRVPEEQEILRTLDRVGYRHITMDQERRAAVFDREGIVFDPGAAGKGFALELVAGLLREKGVTQAILDFGGNLYVIGGKVNQDTGELLPWKTAVRNPDALDSVIGTVPMMDCGIATSSWYEHCFKKDGEVYHHLLNPITGYPLPLKLKSVSILSSSGTLTDLLSTVFFVLGEEKGSQLLAQMRERTGERIEYIAVLEDGQVRASEGAEFRAERIKAFE